MALAIEVFLSTFPSVHLGKKLKHTRLPEIICRLLLSVSIFLADE